MPRVEQKRWLRNGSRRVSIDDRVGETALNESRNVELVLNEQDYLKCFATGQLDLVYVFRKSPAK